MNISASDDHEQANDKPPRRRLALRILSVLLIAIVLLIGVFVVRVAYQGWLMAQSGIHMLEAVKGNPSAAQLPLIRDEFQQIAGAVEAVDRQLSPIKPALNRLEGITTYGSTIAAAPELLSAGSAMADIGGQTLALLTPALAQSGALSPAQLVKALAASGEDLAQLAPDAEAVALLLDSIDTTQLHPAVAGQIKDLQMLGSLLPTGLRLAPFASSLLGFDGPKTYLVLVHNNHELRATGGFISAVGRLAIEDGRVVELDFADSYDLYREDGEYPPAPQAMQQYMNIPVMLFRDTNWSPDFPTSAQLARSYYQQETGIDVDGVVSIDMYAVEKLVQALGPLRIAGADQTITGNNIVDFIKEVWAKPLETDEEVDSQVSGDWWSQRKEFMPALAGAALQRLESGNVDVVALAKAALTSLDERSIQVWLAGSEAAPLLAELGWDGSLQPDDEADFLALVDTNMGYNKVNSVIQPTMRYEVTWPKGEDEPAIATATVEYLHPVSSASQLCDQTPRYGDNYDDMVERCYFDYVRLYVPAGSKLIDARGFELDSVTSRRGENGTQVFTGWFVLPPGQEHEVSFTYELPSAIMQDDYRLVVQRQSGTAGLPLQINAGGATVNTLLEKGRFEWEAEP